MYAGVGPVRCDTTPEGEAIHRDKNPPGSRDFRKGLCFRASHQFTNVNCHHSLTEFPNVEPSVAVTLQR